MSRPRIACVLVLLALAVTSVATTPSAPGAAAPAASVATPSAPGATPSAGATAPSAARGELIEAAREYRASLVRLVALREEAVARARDELAKRRRLVDEGLIARRDTDAAEQALAAAEGALAATRAEITAADALVAEATASVLLASLPPATPGALTVTPMLIRFQGLKDWSLAQVASVERFFAGRFGRALPVSALGQTRVHDRLGFDHRNALDVAVHPDSPEGQALMTWLRGRGVSFFAFRGPVAGESTGAHVHIGEPSPRLTSLRAD